VIFWKFLNCVKYVILWLLLSYTVAVSGRMSEHKASEPRVKYYTFPPPDVGGRAVVRIGLGSGALSGPLRAPGPL